MEGMKLISYPIYWNYMSSVLAIYIQYGASIYSPC